MVVASLMRLLYFAGCVGAAPSGVGRSKQRKMPILETSGYKSEDFHDLTCLLDSSEESLPFSIIPNHIMITCHETYSAVCLKATFHP